MQVHCFNEGQTVFFILLNLLVEGIGASHIDCCLAMLHTCILMLEKQEKDNKTIFSTLIQKKKPKKKTSESFAVRFFFLNYSLFGNKLLEAVRYGPPNIQTAFKMSVINKGRSECTLLQHH